MSQSAKVRHHFGQSSALMGRVSQSMARIAMKNPSMMPSWCVEKCYVNTMLIAKYVVSSSVALLLRRLIWMRNAHISPENSPASRT